MNAYPLSPNLLAPLHLEYRLAEQKRKLREAYYHLHREEVLQILRFRFAKWEKQGDQAVRSALGRYRSSPRVIRQTTCCAR